MREAVSANPLNLKARGDLAELMVASDLLRRGHKVAIPYGEDCDFDLVLIRERQLERVQVKYTRSDGTVIKRQMSLTLANQRQDQAHQAIHGQDD